MTPLLVVATQEPGRTLRTRSAKVQPITFWTEFCNLVQEMWFTASKSISPDAFQQAIWKAVPMFRGHQQQDAQEFMRYILDTMHTELSTRKGRTIIMQAFQGSLFNEVRCLQCLCISTKDEPFLDLSLSIPDRFVRPNASQTVCNLQGFLFLSC